MAVWRPPGWGSRTRRATSPGARAAWPVRWGQALPTRRAGPYPRPTRRAPVRDTPGRAPSADAAPAAGAEAFGAWNRRPCGGFLPDPARLPRPVLVPSPATLLAMTQQTSVGSCLPPPPSAFLRPFSPGELSASATPSNHRPQPLTLFIALPCLTPNLPCDDFKFACVLGGAGGFPNAVSEGPPGRAFSLLY